MEYKYVALESYKRKEHFEYFNRLAYPYVGITANVDITDFLQKIKTNKWPFFLTFCYCVSKAANDITEFRQRILDDNIIEFERCRTSHTVALDDGTYCYCNLDSNMPIEEYIAYAIREQENARQKRTIDEDEKEALNYFFYLYLAVDFLHINYSACPNPGRQQPKDYMGEIFQARGQDTASGIRIMPSCLS